MTFEEWFVAEYGEKPDLENDNYAQIAKAAWIAGADHQDQFHEEMQRIGYE